MKLSDYIEQKQKKLGIKDTEMAVALGISSQRVGYYRRGDRNPKIDFYQKWKRVYNEDLETIVSNIKYSETKTNNSDPPQELTEEIKKLKEELEDRKIEIRNLNRAYSDLSDKYDNLERNYKSLNVEPLTKIAGAKS